MEQITQSQFKPSLSLGIRNEKASSKPIKGVLHFGLLDGSIDIMSKLVSPFSPIAHTGETLKALHHLDGSRPDSDLSSSLGTSKGEATNDLGLGSPVLCRIQESHRNSPGCFLRSCADSRVCACSHSLSVVGAEYTL